MRLLRLAAALLAFSILLPLDAGAWDRGSVERFATLPPGALNPEGIAVDRNGDVYATGFDPSNTHPAQIYVFDKFGQLKRVLNVTNSSAALLGIAFHPRTGSLLVADLGLSQVVEVNRQTGAGRVFTSIDGNAGPNALAFDAAGNVYVSGSFSGKIYRTGQNGGANTVWVDSDLLRTTGFPPFGANGIDFNHDESALFVANTGNDTVVRVPKDPVTGAAGTPTVFTNSINGADGLLLDDQDNVWVCANQADEIVVTDPSGKAIAKLGDFNGVSNGSPEGLLFPASLARAGGYVYITNLSLDLRPPFLTGQQSVDSQWAARVTRHTISRIRSTLP